MFQLPPVPTWDGLHPLIIHFPVVLLMIAPLFILIGAALSPRRSKTFFISALILMVLGTSSTFVAIETGEAAGKLATRTPEINHVLEQHERLAERTRLSFSILTIVFAALLLLPRILKRENRLLSTVLPLAFLVIYAGATVLLANTAHNGGRLVHEFGVQALVAPTPGEAPAQGE
jgi:uncharacterized membrane protein